MAMPPLTSSSAFRASPPHNLHQGVRVSDRTAFIHLGRLIEEGPTDQMFTNPTEKRTEDYITGRYG